MASYVDQALIQDEKVTYRGELSAWGFFWPIFFGLLLLPVFGLGLLIWLWAWITYRSTELAVTNKRIIVKTGFIQRNTIEMFHEKVESIHIDQGVLGGMTVVDTGAPISVPVGEGVLGRIFDFGSITVSGTGGDKSPVNNVARPLEFRKAFMTAVDAARK